MFSRGEHLNRCINSPKKSTIYDYLGKRVQEEGTAMPRASKRGQRAWGEVNQKKDVTK